MSSTNLPFLYKLNGGLPCSGQVAHPGTNGIDWVMPSNANYALLRFGSCYSDGDGTGVTSYYAPSVRELLPGRLEAHGLVQMANEERVQYVETFFKPPSRKRSYHSCCFQFLLICHAHLQICRQVECAGKFYRSSPLYWVD